MVEERGTKPCNSMQDISVLSTQRKLDLASWGLPVNILKVYLNVYTYCWLYVELIYVIMLFQLPRLLQRK
jgi:hypothetical protein